jgi:HEAT repeat protein
MGTVVLTLVRGLLRVLERSRNPEGLKRGLGVLENYLARDEDLFYRVLLDLRDGGWTARYFVGTGIGRFYSKDREAVIKTLRSLAMDPHRLVRDGAAWGLSRLLQESFWEVYPLFREMAEEGEARIRMAVLISLVPLIREGKRDLASPLAELLEVFLSDPRAGVRNNLGPRVLALFAERHPDVFLKKAREWMGRENEVVRWNVATGLRGIGREDAREILQVLAGDPHPLVREGALRTLEILGLKEKQRKGGRRKAPKRPSPSRSGSRSRTPPQR